MLSPYTVLDLTDDKGEPAGMVFRDLGAGVINVEPATSPTPDTSSASAATTTDPASRRLCWASTTRRSCGRSWA